MTQNLRVYCRKWRRATGNRNASLEIHIASKLAKRHNFPLQLADGRPTGGDFMKVPIRFPTDAEIIEDETARFRALTLDERTGSILGMVATGARMLGNSPKKDFAQLYASEQREASNNSIREFIRRHGG